MTVHGSTLVDYGELSLQLLLSINIVKVLVLHVGKSVKVMKYLHVHILLFQHFSVEVTV